MLPSRGGTKADEVPRLPRTVNVDVTKCHACHTNSCNVHRGQTGPKRATRANPVPYVPRLQHKVKVDVPKCHACHTNSWGDNAANENQARHQSQPSAIRATPAKQSDGGCRQVPRLPSKVKGGCRQVPRPATQTAVATAGPKRTTRASPVP